MKLVSENIIVVEYETYCSLVDLLDYYIRRKIEDNVKEVVNIRLNKFIIKQYMSHTV